MKNKTPDKITWTAPSHVQHIRSPLWYLIFGLISLGLISYAVYTRSVLTGITFFLIIFVILVFATQQSRETTSRATKTGVATGTSEIPYKVIKKFWIIYNPPEVKTLNLETTAYLNNRVILQLGNQDPVELKLFLSQYLPEDLDAEESITDSLARRLKI